MKNYADERDLKLILDKHIEAAGYKSSAEHTKVKIANGKATCLCYIEDPAGNWCQGEVRDILVSNIIDWSSCLKIILDRTIQDLKGKPDGEG